MINVSIEPKDSVGIDSRLLVTNRFTDLVLLFVLSLGNYENGEVVTPFPVPISSRTIKQT